MHRAELTRVMRFLIVGGGVAVIYIVALVFLTRGGMVTFWANLVAFLVAISAQYLGHTLFTFQRHLGDHGQAKRFLLTVSVGLIFSSTITSIIAPYFHWPSWLSAGLVAVSLPFVNYIIFRFWVYRIEQFSRD